jgi:hypothetical protein
MGSENAGHGNSVLGIGILHCRFIFISFHFAYHKHYGISSKGAAFVINISALVLKWTNDYSPFFFNMGC